MWCGVGQLTFLCDFLHHKQHENWDLTCKQTSRQKKRSPTVSELASLFVLIPDRDLDCDSVTICGDVLVCFRG